MGIFDALLADVEVEALLDDRAQALSMVVVERALAIAEGRLGVIVPEAADAIAKALAGFEPDLTDLATSTAKNGVPVPGLVSQLRDRVGSPVATFVHWGATSQDIIDTALVLQLREVVRVLEARLGEVIEALASLADAHRDTLTVARTRFQQALPTTFSLKVAAWIAPLLRHRERLTDVKSRLFMVQLGGAAGNLAAFGEHGVEVMEALAEELQLACPDTPWHSQRDTLVEFGSWLALVSGSLGKMGQDVLLLAQNEIGEVREHEGGGSSTMPQKSNPIRSEALVTLARRNAALAATMYQALLHAQERDGAAWQLEWSTLPAMASATAAALAHARNLARSMTVDQDRMRRVLDESNGLLLAEAATFALVRHMPRSEAQALVKQACEEVQASGRHLIDIISDQTSAPVDWISLREQGKGPATAHALVDRVLKRVRGEALGRPPVSGPVAPRQP